VPELVSRVRDARLNDPAETPHDHGPGGDHPCSSPVLESLSKFIDAMNLAEPERWKAWVESFCHAYWNDDEPFEEVWKCQRPPPKQGLSLCSVASSCCWHGRGARFRSALERGRVAGSGPTIEGYAWYRA
jgi:hypothetical protein